MPKIIDVDVETTGLQWYSRNVFLVQFGDERVDEEGFDAVEVFRHPEDREEIQKRLNWRDNDYEFRAHNTKFDAHFLLDAEGYDIAPLERWHDSMVKAHLVDERFSTALKARSGKLFGESVRDYEKAVKAWIATEKTKRQKEHKAAIYEWLEKEGYPQKRNKLPQIPAGLALPEHLGGKFTEVTYADVPEELMIPYAKEDIVLTRQLDAALTPKMSPKLMEIYEEIERPVMAALFELERRGLPMDRPALHRLASASSERLEILDERTKDLAEKRNFNPGSSKQVVAALERVGADLQFTSVTDTARKQGLTHAQAQKKGMLKMDEENLSAVDHPLAQAVLDFRGENKLLGTYVLPMLNPGMDEKHPEPFLANDDRIHGDIRQMGTRTGRMSSANPNMQNWPRDDLRLRYAALADPGYVFVSVDMDAIEARILAYYTLKVGGGPLLEMLREGKDIHCYTSKMTSLNGRQRANGFESPRQQGKRLNYLKMYRGGVKAIRKFFLVNQSRAREINQLYERAYPEIGLLDDQIQWKLGQRGYIETLYGRRQRLDKPLRQVGYKFLNYLIQGTAADMLKVATVRLHRQGVPLVAAVHDELVAHVPEADAERTAKLMEEALTDFPKIGAQVPLGAESNIVKRWSQAKDPDYIPEHERNI